MVKVVQGPEMQSQNAVAWHGRGESVAVCQLLTASCRHQVRPAVPCTACVVTVSASGVQMMLVAAATAVDQTDCDLASVVLHLRVVLCEQPVVLHTHIPLPHKANDTFQKFVSSSDANLDMEKNGKDQLDA